MSTCATCHIAGINSPCVRCSIDDNNSIEDAAAQCTDCQTDPLGACTACCTFAPLFRRLTITQLGNTKDLLERIITNKQTPSQHKTHQHHTTSNTQNTQPQHAPKYDNKPQHAPNYKTDYASNHDNNQQQNQRTPHYGKQQQPNRTPNNNRGSPQQPHNQDQHNSFTASNEQLKNPIPFYASHIPYTYTDITPGDRPNLVHLVYKKDKKPRSYHYYDKCPRYARRRNPAAYITRIEAEGTQKLSLCHSCSIQFAQHYPN